MTGKKLIESTVCLWVHQMAHLKAFRWVDNLADLMAHQWVVMMAA
jgi:hypothetical protein